jgi:hypothetical protein
MNFENYNFLKFRSEKGVLFVTIDHSEVNVRSLEVTIEFLRLSEDVTNGRGKQVVVFDSDNSEFSAPISKLETWFNSQTK